MAGQSEFLCYICKREVERTSYQAGGYPMVVKVACPICGKWKGLFDTVIPDLNAPANAGLMPFLSAYIRQWCETNQGWVELTSENWRTFAEQHAHTPVVRKLDLLLRWFERSSEYAGAEVGLPHGLYPLVDARGDAEVLFLAETLEARGELEPRSYGVYRITGEGWDHLAPSGGGGVPGTCFIAMSIDASLDAAFNEGILPAVHTDCGFLVNRVDRTSHNDSITDRIIAGIRSAQFIVADFTLQRQNVYYEAGFAQGLGRTVIRTCRDTDIRDLHFDTSQYFHLKWSTPADLRVRLAEHVKATIGTWGGGSR